VVVEQVIDAFKLVIWAFQSSPSNSFESNLPIGGKLRADGHRCNGSRWLVCCETVDVHLLIRIHQPISPFRPLFEERVASAAFYAALLTRLCSLHLDITS
jgi:hypothetical protein